MEFENIKRFSQCNKLCQSVSYSFKEYNEVACYCYYNDVLSIFQSQVTNNLIEYQLIVFSDIDLNSQLPCYYCLCFTIVKRLLINIIVFFKKITYCLI